MPSSKYLSSFSNLEKIREKYTLFGNRMLLERIVPDEVIQTKSGILIPTDKKSMQVNTVSADRPEFFFVLAVGNGYTRDDGSLEPLDTVPGQIVMIPKLSVRFFSYFGEMSGYDPDTIGIARESDIEIKFDSDKSYQEFFRTVSVNSDGGS